MRKKKDQQTLWRLGTNAANRLIADSKPKTHADKLKRDKEIILFRAGWIVGWRAAMRSRSIGQLRKS
jgi:hypothetical protein